MMKNKEIAVHYYAILRDERGVNQETVHTDCKTALDFYQELQQKYRFSLPYQALKVTVNNEFVDWGTELKNRDLVIFIPPVSGG